MRRYESVVIMDPDVNDDDITAFKNRYGTLIKTSGGEVIKIEDWGSRRLAYQIKKRDRGRYLLFDYVGLPALITELERQLKIADEVMKFVSVKLDDEVDLDAFKTEAAPAEAAATTEAVPSTEVAATPEAVPSTEVAATPEAPAEAPAEPATEAATETAPEAASPEPVPPVTEAVEEAPAPEQAPAPPETKEGE